MKLLFVILYIGGANTPVAHSAHTDMADCVASRTEMIKVMREYSQYDPHMRCVPVYSASVIRMK